jgi:spermidine synthase
MRTTPSHAPRRPAAPVTLGRLPLEVLVFVVGVSTLGAEIAAARLMAPFFGASTVVWANTIAVVLVALSVGYWFGGRLADRRPDLRSLCGLVVVASVLLGLVPVVADPFLSLSVEAFDRVSVGAFAGSLFGVLVLVAAPVLLLGAVSPWAIRLKLRSVEGSGETAGRMYAISTVGSLVGTFASSLLLIPLVGTTHTFLILAVLCAGVAAIGLGGRWLAAPAALVALLALPDGAVKASGEGRVIHETNTTHQYARVVELPDGERHLELNEGQAVHSVYRPDSVLTGDYWDTFLVDPLAVLGAPPRRVAMLGNAGGTAARAYARYFPATRIDAVELDGRLNAIARRWFGLRPRPQLRLFAQDARPFLRRTEERYDAIFLDAYRQPYVPWYLTTREFFELVADRLAPGGVAIVNVGHPEGSGELERVLTATMRTAFTHVARDPVEPTNTMLVASATAPSATRLQAAAGRLPRPLDDLARSAAARLAPGLPGGPVYTDDRAPVEWLIDKSIVEFAAGG